MLNKVTAKNFLSWKDLTFNVTKGATLVDGWNEDDGRSEGSGKSAILNAICWAIYGKLPKDANVDDVIKDGESSCSVVLEFDNGDAIVRSRKPNELFILKAGATVKGKDAKETQSFIEEYVGCNFETFCQSVYFAQNYDKKFLSSNQADKGKILSSIQNLQIFDKARKETMDLLKLENEKIVKLKNQVQVEENNFNNYKSQKALVQSFIQDKIQKHQQQVSMLTQQRDLVAGHMKKTLADLEFISQQVSAIDVDALVRDEQELNQAKSEYSTQLGGVNHQKSQIDTIKRSVMAKENEGKNLAERYKTIEARLKSLNPTETHRYKALAANRNQVLNIEQNPTRMRLVAKAKQLEDFIANPTKICPSCGTELKTADTSHTQAELATIRQEIEQISVSAQAQADDIARQMNEEVIAIGDQSTQLSKDLHDVLNQLTAVGEYLEQNKIPSMDDLIAQETQIKGVISQIDQALIQTQQKKMEHSRLSSQVQSLNNQYATYQQQHTQFEYSITQIGQPDVSQDQSKLAEIENQLVTVETKRAELGQLLSASESHAQKLETLKEGFKEIKSYVFTNALNELNFRANQYLNELFEMEASIKFSNVEQDIETKLTLDGHERSIGLLSGGQNRRFNLAVDLALADIVSYRKTSKLDLLIFDEYFKDLSEISMEKSLELLKARKCPVILIEHNTAFKNIVDNTFFVRLQDGTSFESRA